MVNPSSLVYFENLWSCMCTHCKLECLPGVWCTNRSATFTHTVNLSASQESDAPIGQPRLPTKQARMRCFVLDEVQEDPLLGQNSSFLVVRHPFGATWEHWGISPPPKNIFFSSPPPICPLTPYVPLKIISSLLKLDQIDNFSIKMTIFACLCKFPPPPQNLNSWCHHWSLSACKNNINKCQYLAKALMMCCSAAKRIFATNNNGTLFENHKSNSTSTPWFPRVGPTEPPYELGAL